MKKLAIFAATWLTVLLFSSTRAVAQEEPEEEQAGENESTAEEDAGDEEASDVEEPVDEEALGEPEPETDCTNQVDDDRDGDTDCDDYDCLDHEACYEEEDNDDTEEPAGPTISLDDGDERNDDELIDVPEEDEEEDDDWTDRPLDMFEIHGYYRLRGDIFHNIHMARGFNYDEAIRPGASSPRDYNPYHPRPVDHNRTDCGGEGCRNDTFAGANMRFRFEPIINLGDQIRILSQIDILDNVILGSTPEGSYYHPSGVAYQSPWVPLRFFSNNQQPPGLNTSLSDAISVRRVWAEVTTPFGQLHFGRMGSHWGMGMLNNAGNGIDDDYGDSVDRIMLATRLWGILLAPGVEFVNSGESTRIWADEQGQPLDAAQLDDVMQYFLVIARRLPREEQAERMRRGDLVLNGGLYFTFRNQVLSRERSSFVHPDDAPTGSDPKPDPSDEDFVLRDAWAVVPDLWFQLYYRGFHLEFEAAFIGGQIEENPTAVDSNGNWLLQYGGVVRADYTALEGQLNVGLEFGYASGDAEYEGLTPRQIGTRMTQQGGYDGSTTDSLFRFDPDFNVDLILFEQILGAVSGAYYFRPWVQYEFIRNTLGVRADVIYSLASEPMQTIGNSPHLGVELNAAIWFRGRSPFNFTAMLAYGILFPLAGFKDPFTNEFDGLEYPQTVQVNLGVHY